jgi:GNAT superfamily N-acetyltransferase
MSQVIECTFDPIALRPLIDAWIEELPEDFYIDPERCFDDFCDTWRKGRTTILLLVINDLITGFLSIYIEPNRPLGCFVGNEQYTYILPSYRKGRNATKLVKAAEELAREKGCRYMAQSVTIQDKERSNRIVKMHERRGYQIAVIRLIKEIDDG